MGVAAPPWKEVISLTQRERYLSSKCVHSRNGRSRATCSSVKSRKFTLFSNEYLRDSRSMMQKPVVAVPTVILPLGYAMGKTLVFNTSRELGGFCTVGSKELTAHIKSLISEDVTDALVVTFFRSSMAIERSSGLTPRKSTKKTSRSSNSSLREILPLNFVAFDHTHSDGLCHDSPLSTGRYISASSSKIDLE